MEKRLNFLKKMTARQFAPAGLWISGLSTLILVITLFVKLFIFIKLYTPPEKNIINPVIWISLGTAIIGLALFALLDPQRTRAFLTGRQSRHGSNAIIMLIAFILILFVINAIVYQNPIHWDWTEGKQNTLAPATTETLNALHAPVHAIGFFTTRISISATQDLFTKLKNNSKGKFTFEFVDTDTNPAKAQQYNYPTDGSVMLVMQGRQELVTNPDEPNLTNALMRLMNPGQRAVYFLTGHGERDIQNSGNYAYASARVVLESKNYTVKTLNLFGQNKIPADALSIIIDGPTKPIPNAEITLLENYVAKGGSLVVLEDPSPPSDSGKLADPMVNYLSVAWGITIKNDIVIDQSTPQPLYAVENTYGSHQITDKLISQKLISYFPAACSLSLNDKIQNVQTTALVTTSDSSWGETDFTALQNNQFSLDTKVDFPGPLTIATAAENSSTKSRVVVICNSAFASDPLFYQYGNGDLFINSVDWAAGQESTLTIKAAQPINRQMRLLNNWTILLLAISFIILIPGLVIASGVVSWINRRKRG